MSHNSSSADKMIGNSPRGNDMKTAAQLDRNIEELFQRRGGDIKPGVERIAALLGMIGNPQDRYLSIHIAGSNGKGSVAAMVESIMRAVGLKTGLYTSPHLVSFNERIKIGGEPVESSVLGAAYERVMAAERKRCEEGEERASFFEMATAIGFECFRLGQIQVAVVETGMGGRWDATNMLSSAVAGITPISIEHSHYLGASLEKIAAEKAGIIKIGRPVVIAEQRETARAVIENVAKVRVAPMRWVPESVSVDCKEVSLDGQRLKIESSRASYPALLCPLLGEHQLANAAQAVAIAEEFCAVCGIDLDPEAVKTGLGNVSWPGRGQVFSRDPLVLLDGAHNPAAAKALAALLRRLGGRRKLGLIVSFLKDKDAQQFIAAFGGRIDRCWVVPLDGPRAMAGDDILAAVKAAARNSSVCGLEEAYKQACDWAEKEKGMLCVTGSLYLIGEFLQ